MGLFGGGNSTSSSTSTQTDARVVGGDDSSNVSQVINGSGNTVLDAGAVRAGIGAALAGIESATAIAKQAQEAQGSILAGALELTSAQQAKFTETVSNIKTSDVRVLIVAGLAVVGLIGAALAFRKG